MVRSQYKTDPTDCTDLNTNKQGEVKTRVLTVLWEFLWSMIQIREKSQQPQMLPRRTKVCGASAINMIPWLNSFHSSDLCGLPFHPQVNKAVSLV